MKYLIFGIVLAFLAILCVVGRHQKEHYDALSTDHDVLIKLAVETRDIAKETNALARDTNEKVNFLYNMAKSQGMDFNTNGN